MSVWTWKFAGYGRVQSKVPDLFRRKSKERQMSQRNSVRNLMRGPDEIDADELEEGSVCWNPPDQAAALTD